MATSFTRRALDNTDIICGPVVVPKQATPLGGGPDRANNFAHLRAAQAHSAPQQRV